MVTHLAWKHRPGLLPEQAMVATRAPGRLEAVIRPSLVGLCGTDRGIVAGIYPGNRGVVLGHEGIGVVEQVGEDVAEPIVGQRVVVNPTQWCDRCAECRRGRTNACQDKAFLEIGVSVDGLLQQSCTLPVRALHLVPPALPDRAAVMIEPLACVLHALGRADLRSVRDALVLGGGPIGCVAALALTARIRGPLVIVEPDPRRHEFIATRLRLPVTPASDPNNGYDLIVDTVGNQLEAALSVVRTGGTVLVMGCRSDARAVIKPLELISRQVGVVFSSDYDAEVFPRAIEAAQELPVGPIVSDELAFGQVDAAFALLGVGTTGDRSYRAQKVVIRVS